MDDKPLKGKPIGIILTLFTNLIGFILCLVLGDEDCRKASIATFIIAIIASFVLGLLYGCVLVSI